MNDIFKHCPFQPDERLSPLTVGDDRLVPLTVGTVKINPEPCVYDNKGIVGSISLLSFIAAIWLPLWGL